MPRRKYKVRLVQPDLVYNSLIVGKLINLIMRGGKKNVAQQIVYQSLDNLKAKKIDPKEALDKIIENIGPRMIVKPRRIGGASYMVPKEITPKHRIFLALKWLIEAAQGRSNKEYHTFVEKLTAEFLDAYEQKGTAVEKKLQTHKLAEANKVFAHFSW